MMTMMMRVVVVVVVMMMILSIEAPQQVSLYWSLWYRIFLEDI
jgi:hypothetical protein